jgi:energy-coupling factor transport system substrate-specific component
MKNRLTILELVFLFVSSVALGILFWVYSFPYKILSPLLKLAGINGIFAGFYHIAGPLMMYILRKPGSAFLGEALSAAVSGLASPYGMLSFFSGILQGLGSEVVFYLTRYRRFGTLVLIAASIFSVIFGYVIIYFFYYRYFSISRNLIRFLCEMISSIFLSGLLSKKLGDRIARTGSLNHFAIVLKNAK